ncbi:hypothetical protein EOL70_03420 [Leucothrix sargassi]|nr:hypothetical protein EOL70_03420 [Leucothrix sargassi]
MNILRFSAQALPVIVLLSLTSQAHALSCMRPDPVQSCKALVSAKQSPVIANGQLTLGKVVSQGVARGSLNGRGPAVAEYSFTGTVNDGNGERTVKDAKLRVETTCAGPWCPSLPKDKVTGQFLFKADEAAGMRLDLGACSNQPQIVTEAQKAALKACVESNPNKPVVTVKPEPSKNKGISQIFSQGSGDKPLVK